MDAKLFGGLAIYFTSDCADQKVIHRIGGLMKLGFDVTSFSFIRNKYNSGYEPFWNNIDLGNAADHAYVLRVLRLWGAIGRVWRHRAKICRADFILARNIDMAILALLARGLAGGRAPVVYEVLDVHRFLIGNSLLNRALRSLERWVLRRCDGLIVSSPAFIHQYFGPMQNYRGRWFLLENKAPAEADQGTRQASTGALRGGGRPWVIGWFGTLRCVRSLEILVEVARRNRGRVRISMRGRPTELEVGEFLQYIRDEPNVVFGGSYRSPDELSDIYAGVDLNWCIDLYDAGKNSAWLLPNRLYEGGLFKVPAIALSGTETARVVRALGIGWVLEEPLVDSLTSLLRELTSEAYAAACRRFATLPAQTFLETDELERVCVALLDRTQC